MGEFYNNILSSSDDEDILDVIYRRARIIRERPAYIETLEDNEFQKRFRLSKGSVNTLLAEIDRDLMHDTERNHAISPIMQLLLTLRYYATGSHLIAAGDFSGVSKTSAHRIVQLHRVTAAIASLRPIYIKLPASPQEQLSTQIDFYERARFPKVICALDCTHVRIQSPGGNNAEVFRNRKGYFSINVQATCDAHLKITDIVARWPGSAHDSMIFNNSRLHARLEGGEFGNGLVLADSGYGIKRYLITPLLNPETQAEHLFNEAQIRTRNTIERTFGVWKRRFPCLVTGMRFSVNNVLSVIVATAVLHNKARVAADPLPPNDPELNINWDVILNEDLHNIDNPIQDDNTTRRALIDYYGRALNGQ